MKALGALLALAALIALSVLAYRTATADPESEKGADGGSGHPNTSRKK